MKKILKIIGVVLVLFIVYCFLSTSPSKELIIKLEEVKIEFKTEKFSNKYSVLIDYEKPIFKKRLWVIDNKTNEVILNSHVSHAKESGMIYVNLTSNKIGSKISSVGVFKTLNSYESNFGKGEYKIGMQLKGLQKNINSNVTKRSIVFHSSYGLWSDGCFMTTPKTNKKIIDLTKNGSLVFVNYK